MAKIKFETMVQNKSLNDFFGKEAKEEVE